MPPDQDGASVDQLRQSDTPVGRGDVALAVEIKQQKVTRHRQANRLREVFFWFACTLAFGTTVTSIGLVVSVIGGVELQQGVAIAFISGLAVETIGILAIMAGYLFPRDRGADDE